MRSRTGMRIRPDALLLTLRARHEYENAIIRIRVTPIGVLGAPACLGRRHTKCLSEQKLSKSSETFMIQRGGLIL